MDDDLEALRMAALKSIKPKKQQQESPKSSLIKAHPTNSNLVSIVPIEEDVVEKVEQRPRPGGPEINTDDSDSESEYEEYSEYVTDSEQEDDEKREKVVDGEAPVKVDDDDDEKVSVKHSKSLNEDDDILQLHDDEDEFASLLNEFEDELEDKKAKRNEKLKIDKKEKKTKRVVKKRKVVKEKKDSTKVPEIRRPAVQGQTRSRSPYYRRSPPRRSYPSPGRSYPRSRYSPPPRYSRYSRSPMRYSRSPPPRYARSPRRYSRSPGRYSRSPGRSYYRRSPFADENVRSGSAAPKDAARKSKERSTSSADKSKSLPPSNRNGKKRPSDGSDKAGEKAEDPKIKAEREEAEFQARLKLLPSPDREKVLARRRKFLSNKPVEVRDAKKISLHRVKGDDGEKVGNVRSKVDQKRGKLFAIIHLLHDFLNSFYLYVYFRVHG